MTPTNPDCINSNNINYGCDALTKIQYGCLQGICPFYKSKEQFKEDEQREKQRCLSRGLFFKSRSRVIEDMDKVTLDQRKRYYKDRPRDLKVIQYNTQENEYIEYSDTNECLRKTGMSGTQLELLIERNEEWHGWKFMRE